MSDLSETLGGDPTSRFSMNESCYTTSIFYGGVRTYVVNGVAHMLFYVEQPGSDGQIEYYVVARMVAPVGMARAAAARMADSMRPEAIAPVLRCAPEGVLPN